MYLVFNKDKLIFLIENFFFFYRQKLETVFNDEQMFFKSKSVSTIQELIFLTMIICDDAILL